MQGLKAHLALWSHPSAPWTPGQKSELGHRPGQVVSDGTWQLALPAVGRCPRMGWEQRLQKKQNKNKAYISKQHNLNSVSQ